MANTQLPAEVVHEIWRQAEKYTEEKVKAINEEHFNVYNAYIAGATEYAPYKAKYETARTLLEKFISRHEAGLLPDRTLYTEINSFLNGTK